jgi:hypothetical protein
MDSELIKNNSAIDNNSGYIQNSLCVTTMVDDGYDKYIPFFLYTHFRANPFYKVKIFHRKKLDPTVQMVCEKYIKNKWDLVEDAFPDHQQYGRTTAALRFLVPEEEFKDVEYVYFTDVDFLFYLDAGIKDFGAQHYNVMRQSNHGKCYENFAVSCTRVGDNKKAEYGFRMPGVHFVSKEWWMATRAARKAELEKLRTLIMTTAMGKTYDEKMLYDIHKNAGLPITQKGHENWRWHGLHLGGFRASRFRPPKNAILTQGDYSFLKGLYKEQAFSEILKNMRNFLTIQLVFENLENVMKISASSYGYDIENVRLGNPEIYKYGFKKRSVIGENGVI